jgi:hypothetical protein
MVNGINAANLLAGELTACLLLVHLVRPLVEVKQRLMNRAYQAGLAGKNRGSATSLFLHMPHSASTWRHVRVAAWSG